MTLRLSIYKLSMEQLTQESLLLDCLPKDTFTLIPSTELKQREIFPFPTVQTLPHADIAQGEFLIRCTIRFINTPGAISVT